MEKKGFRLLDHPADLGIEAYGSDMAEAFEQAAVALVSVIFERSTVDERESRDVELTAADCEHLLVKWLTEVLYLYDGQDFVGRRFEIKNITPTHLKAAIFGEGFDANRHITKLDVKAITYHQLEIIRAGNAARVKVFLDI